MSRPITGHLRANFLKIEDSCVVIVVMAKVPTKITKLELILMRSKVRIGTFPGMGRARTFADRKKVADKRACRGRVSY